MKIIQFGFIITLVLLSTILLNSCYNIFQVDLNKITTYKIPYTSRSYEDSISPGNAVQIVGITKEPEKFKGKYGMLVVYENDTIPLNKLKKPNRFLSEKSGILFFFRHKLLADVNNPFVEFSDWLYFVKYECDSLITVGNLESLQCKYLIFECDSLIFKDDAKFPKRVEHIIIKEKKLSNHYYLLKALQNTEYTSLNFESYED